MLVLILFKLALSASLKMSQECFRILKNGLKTRLLMLNRYFNLRHRKYTKKEICFNVIWLGKLNREEQKKIKVKVIASGPLKVYSRVNF